MTPPQRPPATPRMPAWLRRWLAQHANDGPDEPLMLVLEPHGDAIVDMPPEREKPDFVKQDDRGWV